MNRVEDLSRCSHISCAISTNSKDNLEVNAGNGVLSIFNNGYALINDGAPVAAVPIHRHRSCQRRRARQRRRAIRRRRRHLRLRSCLRRRNLLRRRPRQSRRSSRSQHSAVPVSSKADVGGDTGALRYGEVAVYAGVLSDAGELCTLVKRGELGWDETPPKSSTLSYRSPGSDHEPCWPRLYVFSTASSVSIPSIRVGFVFGPWRGAARATGSIGSVE
jgi:hypothetical protein